MSGFFTPSGAKQHFNFFNGLAFSQDLQQTAEDILTVVRNSEAQPENDRGATVKDILANKLMITTAGLHVWEQRTNALPDSFNFTAWNVRGNPIVQDRNQLAPDGTLTASTITVGAAGILDLFKGLTGLSASTNHEISFWIKRISKTGIILAQKTSSGAGQTGQWNIDMSFLPDNYVRLTENHPSVTIVQNFKSSTVGALGLFFVSDDGTDKTFNLWGTQLEEGGFVSPYVSTDGATVTRLKDEITQPVSQMGFGVNEGMVVIDLVTPDLSEAPGPTLFSLNDNTAANELLFFRSGLGYRLKHNLGAELIVTGITDLTRHKIAVGWKADAKLNVSVDGTTVQTFNTTGLVNFNPQTIFNLGSDVTETNQLNTRIITLTTYADYSDALLQSRSTIGTDLRCEGSMNSLWVGYLKDLGYNGTINDLLVKVFKVKTNATTGTLADLKMLYFIQQGISSGTLDDRMLAFLKANYASFGGTTTDRLKQVLRTNQFFT